MLPYPFLGDISGHGSEVEFRPFSKWVADRLAYGGCPSAKFAWMRSRNKTARRAIASASQVLQGPPRPAA